MASVGGVAGCVPATPQAESVGKPPLPKRVADFARRNEEHAWRGSAWVAVLLPLAALVFAITVLAIKAWPVIGHNGWYFSTGALGYYGNQGYGGGPGAQFGAWAIIWGTIASSVIAIVIALPPSIGAAFALTRAHADPGSAAARLHDRDRYVASRYSSSTQWGVWRFAIAQRKTSIRALAGVARRAGAPGTSASPTGSGRRTALQPASCCR